MLKLFIIIIVDGFLNIELLDVLLGIVFNLLIKENEYIFF